MKASKNTNLRQASKNKADEFYTQLNIIEDEMKHYKTLFKAKVVYCNCDDPRISKFFEYFSEHFEELRLKKLITTCYKNSNMDLFSRHNEERAVYLEYEGDKNKNKKVDDNEIEVKQLKGDGDFRSPECIAMLQQSDIVVTNPPFSLFREYVAQLVKYKKKFLIIGNKNAITYKEIFSLIKSEKLWIGNTSMSKDMFFDVPESYARDIVETKKEGSAYRFIDGIVKARSQSIWFTNLDHVKRHEDFILYKNYTPEEYPHYDNYNAINVDKTHEIPKDYDGYMGVPISFLDKYNPKQFEILGIDRPLITQLTGKQSRFKIKGKEIYARIVIRNKRINKS